MFEERAKNEKKEDQLLEAHVGHYVSSTKPVYEAGQTTYKEHYMIFPVSLIRPAIGERRDTIVCPVCGSKLGFKINSRPAVSRKKIRLRILGFLAVVIATILGKALLTPSPTTPLRALEAMACLLFFIGGIYWLVGSFMTFSLSLEMIDKGAEGHKLFKSIEGMTAEKIPFSPK
jgi:hypothetical protein